MAVFRTKARAIELLGKGQIADLPTAISELWKNGYDAYADVLECNLYPANYKNSALSIFTLSDDGSGMSEKDVVERWIVIGTDSKTRGRLNSVFDKPERVPMGEKGIGRLSVAYLGDLMLMITKKENEECVAVLIHWQILENFNLFLDDVNIPVCTFSAESDFSAIFQELKAEFLKNLESGDWSEHTVLASEIETDLSDLQVPHFVENDVLYNFLLPESHGTCFIVFDPNQQLTALAQESQVEETGKSTTNFLRSSLSGLYDGFREHKDIKTHFWIHDNRGKRDLIASESFFTDEEMFLADHWLKGKFDSEGFFTGELNVYHKTVIHTFRPVRPPGETPYGPFSIQFGFMEGEAKNSKLTREQWDAMMAKLDAFGGMYIYRDKFRVLPYGRTEYDFLEFEERRSRSAGLYQFSHRRMFGTIDISRDRNSQLKDKAGREGLIRNRAYIEFVDDLKKFFIDLGARYFFVGKDSKTPTLKQQQLEEIQKASEKLLKQEKKVEKQTKTKLTRDLNENSLKIETLNNELSQVLNLFEKESKADVIIYNDFSALIKEFNDKRNEVRNLKIIKPKRVEISKSQENKLYHYNELYSDSLEKLSKCESVINSIQLRLSDENLRLEFTKRFDRSRKDIAQFLRLYKNRFLETFKNLELAINEDPKLFDDLFIQETRDLIPTEQDSKNELESKISQIEKRFASTREEIFNKYDGFIRHIENLSFDIDDDFLVGWYKEQYTKIEQRVEAMQELAQLGMSIEIIDHQFNVLYSEIATSVSFLDKYAKQNPVIKDSFLQLKTAFQELENNHQLLVPLYRTTRRTKVDITGKEIIDYLKVFFNNIFKTYNVKLKSNDSFDNLVINTYESIVKPVFINLVNNAVYWLIPAKDRQIQIIYEDGKILIMNSGEPIEPAYLNDIFTLFFTRRPGGRGIGLYLAKVNLRTIGYDIYATNDKKYNRLGGACFIIEEFKKTDENNEL